LFLFSATRDAHFPLKHLAAPPLAATQQTLGSGEGDLVLAGDFDKCGSVIKNSYGVGLEPGSNKAGTFLAGAGRSP
jgi:hypothetical protein